MWYWNSTVFVTDEEFFFLFSFINEHLYALFQILLSNFLQNKIATFFCHLPDYKNYHTYVLKYFSYEQ